jgi:hypothetical protein
MTMPNKEDLRAAVHRLTDQADEALLIYMLTGPLALKQSETLVDKKSSGFQYSAQQLADLQEASEAYLRGDLKTFSEEEFWERIKQKTGFQRSGHNEA